MSGTTSSSRIWGQLKKYDVALWKKPRFLVLNKADLLDPAEAQKRAKAFIKKLAWKGPWFLISGMKSDGTRELVYSVMEFLEEAKHQARGVKARVKDG